MLTIVLGIVAGFAIGIGIAILFDSDGAAHICATIVVVAILISCYAGLLVPLSGYTDWELAQETELVSLSNSTVSGGVGLVYVSLSASNSYTYRYEIDSEFGTEASKVYKTVTLVGEDVEEVETSECETPVVRVYTRTGKMSIWALALGSEQTKYVFYVPEGTILKEVKLD